MKKLFHCLLLFLFLFISCADEQNFNQLNDLSVVPILATSIFYFELPKDVINQFPPSNFYNQAFTSKVFNETFVYERVLDANVSYQLENTTSKVLNLLIEFLDVTNTVIDSESFTIQPLPSPLLNRQVIYGETGKNLDILRNTTRIRVTIKNLSDSISESIANESKITLRSSVVFRLVLE